MIYIKKENEPKLLKEFIDKQISVNIHPAYGELDDDVKKDIRKTLNEAQGGLCCYCMNRIKSIESCIKNYKDLNTVQKNVLATIETLNLNVKSLKDYRKSLITELIRIINGKTEKEIMKEIAKYQKRLKEKRKPFCGVALYFLKDYLKRKF